MADSNLRLVRKAAKVGEAKKMAGKSIARVVARLDRIIKG